MNINQIKNSLSILNSIDEESLDKMFNKHWIDERLSTKGVKESVKGWIFNILK